MLSPLQFQRDTNHCNMLGPHPCLLSCPVQHYSVLSRETEGKQTDRHCNYSKLSNRHGG